MNQNIETDPSGNQKTYDLSGFSQLKTGPCNTAHRALNSCNQDCRIEMVITPLKCMMVITALKCTNVTNHKNQTGLQSYPSKYQNRPGAETWLPLSC